MVQDEKLSHSQGAGSVEEFLQISPNILATFPARAPVTLYEEDPELNRTVKVYDAETLLSRVKKERVVDLCAQGNLFLARNEYAVFARHLSRHLGALLTEHDLDESQAAEIFFLACGTATGSFWRIRPAASMRLWSRTWRCSASTSGPTRPDGCIFSMH